MNIISNSSILNMYRISVKDDLRHDFDEAGKRNMVTSLAIENGTLAMYNTVDEQGYNLVIELYKDDQAYQEHIASDQYLSFREVAKKAVTKSEQIKLVPVFLVEQSVSINVTTDNSLRVNIVHFVMKDGQSDEFKKVVVPYLKEAMKDETEIMVCYVAQVAGHPNEWYTFQVFQNEGTFKNYIHSAGFKQVQDQLMPLADQRDFQQLDGQVLLNQGSY